MDNKKKRNIRILIALFIVGVVFFSYIETFNSGSGSSRFVGDVGEGTKELAIMHLIE